MRAWGTREENEAAEGAEAEKLRRRSKRKRDSQAEDERWWTSMNIEIDGMGGLQIRKEHRHLGIGTTGDKDDRYEVGVRLFEIEKQRVPETASLGNWTCPSSSPASESHLAIPAYSSPSPGPQSFQDGPIFWRVLLTLSLTLRCAFISSNNNAELDSAWGLIHFPYNFHYLSADSDASFLLYLFFEREWAPILHLNLRRW